MVPLHFYNSAKSSYRLYCISFL